MCDETEDWFPVRELCGDTYRSKMLLLSVARLVSRLRWLRDTAEILGFNSHTARYFSSGTIYVLSWGNVKIVG